MRLLILLSLYFYLVSCNYEKVKESYTKKLDEFRDADAQPSYIPPAGEHASLHLSQSIIVYSQDENNILSDINAGQKLGLLSQNSPDTFIISVDEQTYDALDEFSTQKRQFDSSRYVRSFVEEFENPLNLPQETIMRLSGLPPLSHIPEKEFLIANLDKLAIKDQGPRGTCASFAGIGQLEAMTLAFLEANNTSLSSIDLSEQRFYYMSKPDYWSNPAASKPGSNAGTGFARSNGFEYNNQTFPPGSPEDFNIPLEASCPYGNSTIENNDLQAPQSDACVTDGVIKVTDFFAWLKSPEKQLKTAQEVLDYLLAEQKPVIVSSLLTGNWENNDGLITLADANKLGDTGHASGHSYLVVGAKPLSEIEYPGEGGMCFIIKNSWGLGWGNRGYSCMTAAWFQTYMRTTGFPQAISINANINAITGTHEKDALPPEQIVQIHYDSNVIVADQTGTKRKGTVNFLTDDRTFGTWRYKNKSYKVFYRVTDEKNLEVFGLLNDNQTVTQPVFLTLNGDVILWQPKKGELKTVGKINFENKYFSLCSDKYINICDLNYDSDNQQLVIGLTREETLKEVASSPYLKIVPIKSKIKIAEDRDDVYFFNVKFPMKPGRIDFSLRDQSKDPPMETETIRLTLEGRDLFFQKKKIGQYDDGKISICPDYQCFLAISGQNIKMVFIK